jgi:drug/metabolite transporter (DMT)-like permease
VFFKERLSVVKIASIATAFVGISMLYKGEGGATLSMTGVCLVLMSSLTYALYIVGVNRSSLKEMPGLKLTFYAILFGSLVYIVRLRGGMDLQWLTEGTQWMNALGLALFPSLISMVTIAKAIRNIGATPAAILGALEPLTALFVGVMVFHERLTGGNVVGILLILFAVTLIVVGPRGWLRFKAVWHKRSVG